MTPEAFIDQVAGDWSTPSTWALQCGDFSVTLNIWDKLLSKGIFLGPASGGVLVRRVSSSAETTTKEASSPAMLAAELEIPRFIGLGALSLAGGFGCAAPEPFLVSSNVLSVADAVLATRATLVEGENQSSRNVKVFSEQEFSLRIPCHFGYELLGGNKLMETHKELGLRAYIHNKSSLGYYLNGGQETCPTFFGTFPQLHAVVQTFPIKLMASAGAGPRCALRICAPSSQTLAHVLAATQYCVDNPSTLGVDLTSNAYFAVKTHGDMKLLLEQLASGQPALARNSGIKVVELTYPKGIF